MTPKRVLLTSALLLMVPVMVAAQSQPAAGPLTLQDCFRLALKNSETIAVKKEVIREAEGRFLQSLSGVLPDVTYSYSDRRQDGRSGSNFTLREIPEQKFVFSQPLFSGFKEFAAMAASRAEGRQRQEERKRAEQVLFLDVSDAFYFLLSYREDLEVLFTIRASLEERRQELVKRQDLGRSRPSEVASAEARLSRIDADIERVKSEEEVARQLLEFLIAGDVTEISDTAVDPQQIGELSHYLVLADVRPDVKAAEEAAVVARKEIAMARAGFWPEASLDGNYYTKRVGNSEGVDWDATITVDVPVFKGGENIGKSKEASAKAEGARLTYEETRRRALLDIENAYSQLTSVYRRMDAMEKARNAAEKNYRLQVEDYAVNLVNNLEVLQALEDFQDAQREFITVRNEARRLYWNFKVSIGDIPHDAG